MLLSTLIIFYFTFECNNKINIIILCIQDTGRNPYTSLVPNFARPEVPLPHP